MGARLPRVPEGDTIFRTANTLRRWLVGRTITSARTTTGAPVERLVGQTVEEVEARAKHLLIRCTGNLTVHTHMKMTGSWHVYRTGEAWRRPRREARLVLESHDRVAVCFNAPVVELIERRAEHLHPSLALLGPDVLAPPVDLAEVRRRAAAHPHERPVADLILDQGVVSGIGNIWRAEALFAERLDPATPQGDVPAAKLDALITTASALMARSAGALGAAGAPGGSAGGRFGTSSDPWVYGRAGRPCRRCRTPIRVARFEHGRLVYWCPTCQIRPPADPPAGPAS